MHLSISQSSILSAEGTQRVAPLAVPAQDLQNVIAQYQASAIFFAGVFYFWFFYFFEGGGRFLRLTG